MPLLIRLTSTWRRRVTSPTQPPWNAIVHLVGQIQLLLRRFRRQQVQRVLDARRAGQTAGVPVRACRTSILEKVEDVVDDSQQGFAAGINGLDIAALFGESSAVSSRSPDMAMTPFIGVRISWLMLARNSALARAAASAATRAASSSRLVCVNSSCRCFRPQSAADARPKFGTSERFGYVIDRAQLEPAQFVIVLFQAVRTITGMACVRETSLSLRSKSNPFTARQPKVEQDQIKAFPAPKERSAVARH